MISAENICDPLHGFSRRSGIVTRPFLSAASKPMFSHRLLSMFISVTSIVSPDVPLAEVFIGTMSGWGFRLQVRVTSTGACPSCRTGKSPNLLSPGRTSWNPYYSPTVRAVRQRIRRNLRRDLDSIPTRRGVRPVSEK